MGSVPALYRTTAGSPLRADTEFYEKLADDTASRTLAQRFVVPPRSGRAWEVPAGSICRIVAIEGPQVADLNVWNRHDPRERMWAARTRQLEGAHVTRFNRLWSTLPFLRPLVTIIGDSLESYGVDEDGGRVHELLGSRCDPYINSILSGKDYDFHCHSNLVRAVLPYGLTEFDVHDVLNVFQVAGLNDDGHYFIKPCPARRGDYFEFFAELDLLCAMSTCPGGDLTKPIWGADETELDSVCRPLAVEVYRPDPALLEGWRSPELPPYRGLHGMRLPNT